MQTDKGQW